MGNIKVLLTEVTRPAIVSQTDLEEVFSQVFPIEIQKAFLRGSRPPLEPGRYY